MEESKNTMLLHVDTLVLLTKLSMEQRGAVISCVLARALGGELPAEPVPQLDPCADIVYTAIQGQIDREYNNYQARCEKRRAAAEARWAKERSEEKPKPKRTKTLAYMQREDPVNADAFIVKLDDESET